MFYLHVSNRTENLLKQLAEVIRLDKQADSFDRELFLIQSQGMERMVAQTMASEFRSFCNYKFFLPLDYLHFIAGIIGINSSPGAFSRETLTWRLDGLLRDISGELYAPLKNYLAGNQGEIKRYQLATRLAYIFDQYQIMRPDMLVNWGKRTAVGRNSAEPWQMDLWCRLVRQQEGTVHRGVLFRQVIDRLEDSPDTQIELPKRISVVGLHTIPPIYLDFLNTLGKRMDVHFLLLSPCRDYWDISETLRALAARDRHPAPGCSSDEQRSYHPVLENLGRQGRDLQNMMLMQASVSGEFASYTDPCPNSAEYERASLLERLQSDLLKGALPETSQLVREGDDSVQIVSCHSRQRELMVLKDNLLNLLYRDEKLELRDIVVMAPDIQEYGELIPAFFQDVQHSIADRSLRRRNSTIQAFVIFLRLVGGRYGWSEVMDLLRQPAIYPHFDLSPGDLERIQGWVIGSGIRWGLSGSQRHQGGSAEVSETTWQAGIERLLMGYAIDTDSFVDGILPYPELEGQGALALGGLCSFFQVIERAGLLFRKDCTLAEWSVRLLNCIELLFDGGSENDVSELYTLVGSLSESSALFHSHPVCFDVIRQWFEQSATETRSSSGFLRGHLTFCSMLPMRSIPFKVVCLIGLNDGVFPKQDFRDTFDLMKEDFRPGDRSSRADDRYQFLEALLAARSHLYLSYIGQSIKNNKRIPPSVVVTELLEVLENFYGAQDLVTQHSLHPFSMSYFNNSHPKKFSYNEYYLETATALQLVPVEKGQWFQSTLEPPKKIIEFQNLLTFFANPQKFFVRNCLGIRLGGEESLPEESELFELTGLKKYLAEKEFIDCAGNGDFEILSRKLQNRGQWILGEPGLVLSKRWQREVERYLETVQSINSGPPLEDIEVDLQIGEYRLVGRLSHRHEHGLILLRYGNLRGRDLLEGWLHHLVSRETGSEGCTWVVSKDDVVCFPSTGKPGLETLLDMYSQGCRTPSLLFVEPAFAHLQQKLKATQKAGPLKAATDKYTRRLEKGYEPEWEILFEGADITELFGDTFEELSRKVIHGVWSNRDE